MGNKTRFRLKDLPKLSPTKFTPNNSCGVMRVVPPAHWDVASGNIVVEKECALVGWTDCADDALMIGREDQILLMLWSPRWGEIWEHYPLCDEEEREAAVFVCARGIV